MATWTVSENCVLPCQPLISIYLTTLAARAFMVPPAAGEFYHHVSCCPVALESFGMGYFLELSVTETDTVISRDWVSEYKDLWCFDWHVLKMFSCTMYFHKPFKRERVSSVSVEVIKLYCKSDFIQLLQGWNPWSRYQNESDYGINEFVV